MRPNTVWTRILLGVGAVTLAAGVATSAYGTSSASERSLTIRLWAGEAIAVKVIRDVPPVGFSDWDKGSKGDTVAETIVLRNVVSQFGKPAGARVGTIRHVSTFADAERASSKAVAKLPGGTLRIKTRRPEPPRQDITFLVVTGGTGSFAGARGTMEARYLAPKGVQHIYRLRLP